ncbi:MAG TPA: A24 family peptidase [Acidimicrobiales bacterium]|nr:A24 family peptidase [Acidimicrobiales bacterium]
MDAPTTAVAAVAGLVVGDSLEIVVERLGSRASFERPWWRCASCGAGAGGAGLVPLVRCFARIRGCHVCGTRSPYAWRPAVMAVVCAAVLGGFAARIGDDVVLAPFAVLGIALVAISAVDLERFLIPNRIVYPTLAVVAPLLVVSSAVDHRWGSLARAAIAGAAAFAAFLAVHLAVPKGMGFGDVRLAGLVGLTTGWLGLGHAFVAFLAAFVIGALAGVVVMVVSGGGRKTKIPFGPFLAAGAVVAVLWGGPLAHALFHRGS